MLGISVPTAERLTGLPPGPGSSPSYSTRRTRAVERIVRA